MQISRSFNSSKHKIFPGVNWLCLSKICDYWQWRGLHICALNVHGDSLEESL
uniref:Uncharacterized protein n=1 Tax=Populus trichocarpa x Populus deltoides TaxID=3695 RepID=A9PJ74_9ROSI|nr:unknown [Populus trichocarpa x Populus deltoides]